MSLENYLKELGIATKKQKAIIPFDNLIFELPFYGNLVDVYFKDCFNCSVDCFKKLTTNFKEEINKQVKKILKKKHALLDLSDEDVIFLTKVTILLKEPKKILDLEHIKENLITNLQKLRFVLIGLDEVGKSTIFESFPGEIVEYDSMVETLLKDNFSFSPLVIEVMDLGNSVIENIISDSVAPLIKKELAKTYMFIVVTDSKSRNVITTKQKIVSKLPEINPFALIICIANKQDLKNALKFDTIENILNIRTYPLTAIDSNSYEDFMKIIWETVLLRIEQMKENNCPML